MNKKIFIRLIIPALVIIASAIVVTSFANSSDRRTCKQESMEDCKRPSNEGKLLWESFPGQLFSLINVSN